MKVKKLIGLTIIPMAVAFMGCGGNDTSYTLNKRSPNKPSKNQFDYEANLAKMPPIIQEAMKDNPIQHVDLNKIRNLENKKGEIISCSMTAIPKIITSDQGYSFITVKMDTNVLTEIVFAWDKLINRYSTGIRIVSNSNGSFNRVDYTTIMNMNVAENAKLAGALEQGTRSVKASIRKADNKIYMTNIVTTLNGVDFSKPNFDFPDTGALNKKLFEYLGHFLIN